MQTKAAQGGIKKWKPLVVKRRVHGATTIYGFGDLDLKKGVDNDLKLEKGEVWNKI